MPFAATWMDPETVIWSEISQKDKYHIILLICVIQKNGTNELICKAETESQMQKINLWIPREEGRGGMNWEIGIDIYTLLILCIKQITNENLLYSTGNSVFRGDLDGKGI